MEAHYLPTMSVLVLATIIRMLYVHIGISLHYKGAICVYINLHYMGATGAYSY